MYRRILIAYLLIVLIGAGVLIYKLVTLPDVIVTVSVEPLPVTVKTEVIMGVEPPVHEVKTVINEKTLYILSHIMGGECGADWCSDEMQIATGSVFLNRIESEYFPDDAESVAFQSGQYACTKTGGGYWKEPTKRTVENARYLLEHGSQLPDNVLFQSQFKQGDGIYKKVGNQYYCYKED